MIFFLKNYTEADDFQLKSKLVVEQTDLTQKLEELIKRVNSLEIEQKDLKNFKKSTTEFLKRLNKEIVALQMDSKAGLECLINTKQN